MQRLNITFCAVVIAIAAACTNGSTYTISGTIENSDLADGDSVFLSQYMSDGSTGRVAFATIQGGAFTLQGKLKEVTQGTLEYYSKVNESNVSREIFLEKGTIQYKENAHDWSVSGTPMNEAYSSYRERAEALNSQIGELYSAAMEAEKESQEKRDKIMAEHDKVVAQYEAFIMDEIEKNIGTPVSVSIIRNHQVDLLFLDDMDRLDTLLDAVPDKYATPVVFVLKESAESAVRTQEGRPFVDFSMQDPDGKEVKLSDYMGKGNVVFIDFWASWCGPCRAAIPLLKEIYSEYGGKGFEIVGVSLDSNVDNWKEAIREEGLTWPQMSDLKGWDCIGASLYGIRFIPTTLLVNQQGIIVARNLHGPDLRTKIESLLHE